MSAPMSGNRGNRSARNSVRSVDYATSPLLASKTPPWRSRFVVLLVFLSFLVLLARAVHLQIINTDFYQAEGEKRFVHKESLPASRGRILDRNGLALATSVAMPTVQVDLKLFKADTAQRKSLAKLLAMPLPELSDRLEGNTGTVVLRRHVEETAWAEIQKLDLKGVHQVREFKRRYAEGEAAAHVVGFTDVYSKGIDGIEKAFNDQLVGHNGQRTVVRDRLGRVIEDVGEQANPVHGNDVMLTIDSKVQFFAWQRLRDAVIQHGAQGGSV
ncbi:MAG: penicillin-binding protein 2, partial [Rubrivivax sp.]|nr:penicillin-binding protein 2 [Rubrivivax sp.]